MKMDSPRHCCIGRAARQCANLPRQADQADRAVPGGQRDRPHRPAHRQRAARGARPAGRGREQARRARRHRRGGGRAGGARRLHADDDHEYAAGGEREPVQEAELRPGEGLRAGRAPGHDVVHAHGAARFPGEEPEGVPGARAFPTRESCPPATARPARRSRWPCCKSMGKLDVVEVPYKGIPQAITDTMGGSLAFTFVDLGNALGQAKGGKLKGLGVTSQKRTPLAPDVPAIAEELPGYELIAWFALMAPAKTPADDRAEGARCRGQEPGQARREREVRDHRHRPRADESRRAGQVHPERNRPLGEAGQAGANIQPE